EATILPASFSEDAEACVSAGFPAIEVWLTKFEQHLETHSIADTRRLLAEKNVVLPAAAYQGGLLLSQGQQRKAHFDDFRRRLDLCQGFGISTLLVVADFARAVDTTSLERAVVSLKQAGQWAAAFNVRLALEFRAADAFCTSLDTAVRLTAAAAEPNVGVCLDSFHFFKGPSKEADLELLSPANLFWVQVSDLAGVPRELASDADRILPGDGDLPLTDFLGKLRKRGYDGYVSLELMNPTLWQTKASQVADLGAAALRRILPPG
ncbi:MAG TPA: sugar phosphate isomerase/epimerase family protein, partial [Gemmataceae bacterium]|nr:sugar phosphate isomerase/epimerase family protein [Gemmataceae bacterium]